MLTAMSHPNIVASPVSHSNNAPKSSHKYAAYNKRSKRPNSPQSGRPVSIDRRNEGFFNHPASLQILPDGFGGVVVGWVGDGGPGYSLFADRMSSQGNSMWQLNGKRLLPWAMEGRAGLGLFYSNDQSLYAAVAYMGFHGKYQLISPQGNLNWPEGGNLCDSSIIGAVSFEDTVYFAYIDDDWQCYGSKKDFSAMEYWPVNPWIRLGPETIELMPDSVGGLYLAFSHYRTMPTDWVAIQRIYPEGRAGGDTLTGVSDDPNESLTPTDFMLTSYPNPFNASTLISFQTYFRERVSLSVYDALGNRVTDILNENLNAGMHTFKWDIGKSDKPISSGVYFLRLKVGLRETTKMITLIK